MKLKLNHDFVFCILTSALLLSGCHNDTQKKQLQAYISESKSVAAQKPKANTISGLQLPKAVIYQPKGYTGANQTNANVSNPLQSYPIKSLQFVGTLTQDNKISAYIMTPDNMIYLVNKGDVIGNTFGKVVKIDSDHIEIKESNSGDKETEHVVTMELKD